MSKQRICDPQQEVRIRRMNEECYNDIHNIAAKKGVPATNFIKPVVVEFAKSIPENLGIECKPCKIKKDMFVRGIGAKNKKALEGFADYVGVGVSDLLKVIVAIDSLTVPVHLKTKPAL